MVNLKAGWLKRDTAKAAARVAEWDSVNEYVDGYEFRGEQDYTPNDHEKTIIEDAICGYLAMLPASVDQLAAEIERELFAWRAENGGVPYCPCRMRGIIQRDGRWIEPERDLGPVRPHYDLDSLLAQMPATEPPEEP